jgi:hypothetical protein
MNTKTALGAALATLGFLGALLAATASFAAQDPKARAEVEAQMKKAAAEPTPMAADGHPDLSGYWQVPGGGSWLPKIQVDEKGSKEISVFPAGFDVKTMNELDRTHAAARLADKSQRPEYKPEFAAKAQQNFDAGDLADPSYGCALPGVARLGLPKEIFQRRGSVVLLYEGLVNRFRVIPVDGRVAEADPEEMTMGHSIGRWEGNTLVIVTTGFIPDNWIDKDGSYHSKDLKLTERLTRTGNTLAYQMVAEDPIFVRPFTSLNSVLTLAPAATHVIDEYPCIERDIQHMTNGTKH